MFFIPLVNKPISFLKRADLIVSLFCFLLLSSCNGKDEIIASVNDVELSRTDAELLMEHLGYNINKKSEWLSFIDQWTKNEVLKQELMTKDPEKYKLVELRSSQYTGELSKYYLEEKAILQELDTSVSEKEIKKFYFENKESFSLQDYLVKALYIKVPKGVSVEEKLKNAYLLKNDKDLNQVNSYAKLYAEDFYFDDVQWIYFTELTKDIPLRQFNKDNIVLNRTKTYFSDEEFTYFLNILDFKLKDEAPPLDFLRPQIKEIILSSRVNKLREKLQNNLYKNISKKYDIKNHYN